MLWVSASIWVLACIASLQCCMRLYLQLPWWLLCWVSMIRKMHVHSNYHWVRKLLGIASEEVHS